MRYSPGSLLLIVSPDASESERFAERVVEAWRRALPLEGAHPAGGTSRRGGDRGAARELLDAAVVKRLGDRQTIVLTLDGLDAAERERYVRLAHGLKRPRHLIPRGPTRSRAREERATLNELRRALDSGEIGQEGFQTALRLGGGATAELKRIVFQPPPRED